MESMQNDWEQLEQDVDAGMAAIAPALAVTLPRDVLDRARVAVRVADDELWLAAAGPEAPSTSAIHIARTAVRCELKRMSRTRWWSRNARALSSLASAAMIGICIGVIHFAARRGEPPAQFDPLEAIATASLWSDESDRTASELDEDLQTLEQSLVGWPTEVDRVEDGLQQIDEMLDALQLDSAI